MRLLALSIAAILASTASAATTRTAPEARWQAWEQHRQLEQDSLLKGLQWRPIGPTVQGGRVVDIEVHPDKPYTFYVAYASGGIWKTENNGVTFTPLSDALPTTISGDIAIDPNNPDTIWVGTGEPNSSRSSYSGLGVFVSRDGGQSFSQSGLLGADRIARVIVDPRDSRRVFVAVQGPLYTEGGMRGLYLSEDGGASWQQVLKTPNSWTGASDVVFQPGNPDVMYAALWDRQRRPWDFVDSGKGSGVWKSTDGGRNWSKLAGLPEGDHVGRIGLAVSAAAPERLYVGIDDMRRLSDAEVEAGDSPLSSDRLKTMSREEFLAQDPEAIEFFIRGSDFDASLDAKTLLAQIRSGELTMDRLRARLLEANPNAFDPPIRGITVFRSDDAGQSFRQAHQQPIRDFTFGYGYYFGEIVAAPDNADRLYILGVPVAVSEDGGATWHGRINDPKVHVDHHAWTVDTAGQGRILNGNDGGVDVSYDAGKTWLKLDAQAVGQSYAVAVDMESPYNVYTGMQDNGTFKGSSAIDLDAPGGFWSQGGDGWSFLNGGDGMQIQADPRDASVLYTGYQFGFYRRGGKDGGPVRPQARFDEAPLRFNWMTPILLSSHNPDILYMGANKLFRSMDQGRNFTAISPDLTRGKREGDVPFATITTLAESTLEFGLLAVGTDDGRVHVSEDGGKNWREVTKGLAKDRWISRVEFSRAERGRLYVTQTGYRDDDMRPYVWVSEDLGKRWRSIAANLPAEPVNVLREDPVNPELLYLGSSRGVYASLDRGGSWQALQTGLPNVPAHDLVVHPRDRELVVGTHGRSVWIVDVLPLQELNAETRAKPVALFHVDPVTFERGWRSQPRRWFEHIGRAPKAVVHFWAAESGSATLKVLDDEKQTVREIAVEAQKGLNRFEYDLLADETLGLAAEAKKAEAAAAKITDPEKVKEGAKARTPLAESKRLGAPLYLAPGKYTLALEAGGSTAETSLEIKAPRAIEPRKKPAFELRGKK